MLPCPACLNFRSTVKEAEMIENRRDGAPRKTLPMPAEALFSQIYWPTKSFGALRHRSGRIDPKICGRIV